MTFFYKRIFPVIWFGFCGFILLPVILSGSTHAGFYLFLAVFLGMGFFVMKTFVFDLVDEVIEEGGELIVRNGKTSERISLSNIINVSYSGFVSPPRITLMLREPCSLGKEIPFSPPYEFGMFRKSTVALNLIKKIEAIRQQSSQAP